MAVADSSEKTKEEDRPELEELEAKTGAKEAQGLHLVEDEVLVQGFILSEAHSLMVRPVLLFVFGRCGPLTLVFAEILQLW